MKLLVSCNGPKKNRLGRSIKKKNDYFLVKNVCFMHVLRWLGVWRAEKNFVRVGLQETNNFFRPDLIQKILSSELQAWQGQPVYTF